MKKKILAVTLVALSLLTLMNGCAGSKTKEETSEETEVTTEKDTARKKKKDRKKKEKETEEETKEAKKDKADSTMAVPGYAVGEIPAVVIPELPNLLVKENPNAKITLSMTEKISSVPGITVTPVRVEEGNIVSGNSSMQLAEDGSGQYTDGEKTVQTDGDGSGQYVDGSLVIQRSEDGSGQYIDSAAGITLQVDADGAGQYQDMKRGLSLQVDDEGNGVYKDDKKGISIIVGDGTIMYKAEIGGGDYITITNDGDGSGSYDNTKLDLSITNDGDGQAHIRKGDKTALVDAKPLEKPGKLPKLTAIPAIPAIEANSLLISLDSGVLFDVDKYNIRDDAKEILDNLAGVLKEAGVTAFEIDGHTDSDASDEYNQVLSENRANSVKDYLEKSGVTATITTNGYGESRPVADNSTPEGKQKNRRVEIVIPVL